MNVEEMKKRLGEIQAKLQEFSALEKFTNEDMVTIEALNTEFSDLRGNIETNEKVQSMLSLTNVSARKTTSAPVAVAPVAARIEKNGGFKNAGEFLNSVRRASSGDIDPRFKNNTMFERNGEDGGFLVPDEMMSEIARKVEGEESLLGKTKRFTVSGNSLSIPTDEAQPWTGGIQAYWTAEGAPINDSKGSFGIASWKLHKLAALVKVTDELLEDSVALASYISEMAPQAIDHAINSAIISGTGVGKPTGILNSGFKIAVEKEVAQDADTINARNIVKMYSRMLPASRGKAAFFINPGVEEQLRLIKDDNGNFIYLAPGSQLNQSPYGLLMGRPVIPMLGSLPALGDEGDIIFADLSYYYTITKVGGVQQAISSHLYFDQAIQAFRFTFRIDGSCPFKAPVSTEFGDYKMSAIVTLEDR